MILYLFVLALFTIIGRFTEKKWFNPLSILFVIWSIITILSRIRLFDLYQTKTVLPYVIIMVGLLSFAVGYYFLRFFRKEKSFDLKNNAGKTDRIYINYSMCYLGLIFCILIIIAKLIDFGFSIQDLQLNMQYISTINSSGHSLKLLNAIFTFIAQPLFLPLTVVFAIDFWIGKRDRWLILLSIIMMIGWIMITGGRIAIILMLIALFTGLSFSASDKKDHTLKFLRKIRFRIIGLGIIAVTIFSFLTLSKGFNVWFNIYSSFAIQPYLLEHWGEYIQDNYAFGFASTFGFIYPFLYVFKNIFGVTTLPGVFEQINNTVQLTFTSWIVAGGKSLVNAYTSAFWYLYYDGRFVGVIIGMFIWGIIARKSYYRALSIPNMRNVAFFCLILVGIIYTFTDMEFNKSGYVLSFLYLNIICFCKYKPVVRRKL